MALKQTSELNIVMGRLLTIYSNARVLIFAFAGAMTFGEAGKDQARVHDVEEVSERLPVRDDAVNFHVVLYR